MSLELFGPNTQNGLTAIRGTPARQEDISGVCIAPLVEKYSHILAV